MSSAHMFPGVQMNAWGGVPWLRYASLPAAHVDGGVAEPCHASLAFMAFDRFDADVCVLKSDHCANAPSAEIMNVKSSRFIVDTSVGHAQERWVAHPRQLPRSEEHTSE